MDPQVVDSRPPGVCSLCSCRPLWLGVIATILNLGPSALALAVLFNWIAELPETYLVNNGASVVSSLLDFFGTALIVWASEPERLGRKTAYLFLHCCSIAILGCVFLSGGGAKGAYVYLGLRVIFSTVGGGNPQGATYAVLCAWFASKAPSELHAAGFSVLLGAQFLGMGIFPMLSIPLQPYLGDVGMVGAGACLALVQIPFVLLCFPNERRMSGADGSTQPITQTEQASTPMSVSAFKDIRRAFRWILRNRAAVTVIWLSIQFTGAADSTSLLLFLTKGRGFTKNDVNMVMGSIGFSGCIISLVLVPWLTKYVSKSVVVFIGTACTMTHLFIYAFLSAPAYIIGLGFIGSLMYASIPALLSYMPAVSDSGVSQGVLLGVFSAMAAISKSFGPLIFGACLQAELPPNPDQPSTHDICYVVPGAKSFIGSGFLVLGLSMLPALFASVRLLIQEARGRRGKLQDDGTPDSHSPTGTMPEPDAEVSPLS